ncbi:MAG: SDR family oxidoreductase [Deltaproteobacteria bacterium]|nr:SDR family oxidoreductase [Deltaproteobacteria bacterium]
MTSADSTVAPLAGRTALVTGGARGIGAAIARKLGAAGCDVAIVYYNSHAAAEELCGELRGVGRRALALQADVSDPDGVAAAVARVAGELGPIHLAISNAASGVLRPVEALTRKHWRWCLETNALALQSLAVGLAPHMPRGGRLVALSSLGAERALPGYAFVGASKAALESLVRSLAAELGGRGIAVNAVQPGVVDTDALRAFPQRETLLAEFAARAPLGALSAAQVADAVYLLCLPEAAMISGQTLVVDGGYSIVG